jgi:hypothetical protein
MANLLQIQNSVCHLIVNTYLNIEATHQSDFNETLFGEFKRC